MDRIQVLDPHLADLIAAGEVVERPASVVKELMENAIDAKADSITVEIEHGGLTFLRVTDNGSGIPADQLKTAFLRHATSKLKSEYDLEAICTLGFRGEALAAIAAVSQVSVMSCTQESDMGACLEIEGGVFGAVEEAGCPKGTTMIVRNLFYNTPARLKFMKRDTAEGAAVFAVVQRVALSHPEVSVKFVRDGKQELLTPGDGQLKSAVYAVLGRDLALGFLSVTGSGQDISVTGYISRPTCCRASRNWQFFFLNGRQIKSKLLMAAVEEAYKNQKMVGKFPGCVLHITLKENLVDVNVHPAKTEVKFSDERMVFHSVYHTVFSTLEEKDQRPDFVLQTEQVSEKPVEHSAGLVQQRSCMPTKGEQFYVADSTRPKMVSHPVTVQPVSGEKEHFAPTFTPVQAHRSTKKVNDVDNPVDNVDNPVEKVEYVYTTQTKNDENVYNTKNEEKSTKNLQIKPVQTELENSEPQWHIVGELFDTYLMVEQGEMVFLIDKHAAHERMQFDRMKAEDYQPMSQMLLTPVVCRLPAEEQAVLVEHRSQLEEFGFVVEEFGAGALIVRQVPFDVPEGDVEQTLCEIAQTISTKGSADPSSFRDELLHTMACKAAIKGGWKTSLPELEKVAEAVMTGQVKYCPHGRPVAIELTKRQLEKQFKRT